ncbi:MAG: VWA domain-containing protein [Candidatus Micrarchaeota archaeon]|nr:VWA domain-containing protein [Candidatus Micrarchaeota archaeon]
MGYRKAQVSGLDLILALMLFLTVLVLFTILWDMVHYNVKSSANADLIAIEVANKLLDSPGYPYDWSNETNVQVIGLSSERGVIDQAKLENLLKMLNTSRPDFEDTYNLVRELLGLGPYQLCINLTDEVGNPIKIDNQNAAGGNCNISGTSASSVKRTALYGQITVHNNSITFIFDSSGSMGWYSTSLGSATGTLSSSWVNAYNVTFPPASDNFDFVLETNDSSGFNGRINVTSPSGIKYGCRDSNPTCGSCGTGCTPTHYSGADYLNFLSSRWETGVWKVYVRKYGTTNPLSFDMMAQTPAIRVDAAKTATNAFVDVISNESKGVDEMSLFRFNPNSCSCNPCWQRIQDFTSIYPNIKTSVNSITAGGGTPLDASLRAAADYTNSSAAHNKHRMIIVVSDGSETCNGNVVSAATYAADKVEKICTVGFAQGSTGEAQLKQVAAIGKCQYYAAKNEQELELALKRIYFGQLEKQKVILNIVVWR